MSDWAALRAELDRWQAAGRTATFWWRDDDAGPALPALDRLLVCAATHRVPIGLAVIPTRLDDLAVRRIGAEPLATPLLHGLAHRNHAAAGEKKSEFPLSRAADAMLGDLGYGLHLLRAAFGGRALPILVPPWNRIAPALVPSLPSIGLRGLSRYLAREAVLAAPGLTQVNGHVDLIDWHGTRGFVGEGPALGLIVRHLEARRTGTADPDEPTGLLSHHLVHDAPCWSFLDRLLPTLMRHPAVRIHAPPELFPEASHAG